MARVVYSTPLTPLTDPLQAFNQLFAGNDATASAAEQALRRRTNKSVLDFVQADAASLTRSMSAADQQKLDEYLTGVRTLETKLLQPPSSCGPGAYLAQRLRIIPEGNGTLLDNTVVALLPGMGNGNAHDHMDITAGLIGGCGGALTVGTHTNYHGAPMANLHVTLMTAMGLANKTFGMDGNAPLAGLLAQ